jgi:hypothetical protein
MTLVLDLSNFSILVENLFFITIQTGIPRVSNAFLYPTWRTGPAGNYNCACPRLNGLAVHGSIFPRRTYCYSYVRACDTGRVEDPVMGADAAPADSTRGCPRPSHTDPRRGNPRTVVPLPRAPAQVTRTACAGPTSESSCRVRLLLPPLPGNRRDVGVECCASCPD